MSTKSMATDPNSNRSTVPKLSPEMKKVLKMLSTTNPITPGSKNRLNSGGICKECSYIIFW